MNGLGESKMIDWHLLLSSGGTLGVYPTLVVCFLLAFLNFICLFFFVFFVQGLRANASIDSLSKAITLEVRKAFDVNDSCRIRFRGCDPGGTASGSRPGQSGSTALAGGRSSAGAAAFQSRPPSVWRISPWTC